MENYYHQFSVKVDRFKEEVESFLMDRFYNGIEEREEWLILRGDSPFYQLEKELKKYLHNLEQLFGVKIELETSHKKLENRDWIENYKNSITGVEVGKFYIRPSWRPPKPEKIDLQIDPDLAFGTGHHETTRGALKLLEKAIRPGDTLLDVGTGSGILGIAGAKLGAVVSGCDTDPLAVESARRNGRLNKIEWEQLWLGSVEKIEESRRGGSEKGEGKRAQKYTIVVANIVAEVLIDLAPKLKQITGKYLILSGIIDKYLPKVLNTYRDLKLIEQVKEKEWIALLFKKNLSKGSE